MTEIQLKEILRRFHEIKLQNSLAKEYEDMYGDERLVHRNKVREIRIKIIENAIEILGDMEKFVLQTHLIQHHTWTETGRLFLMKYGICSERSERTLKRMQQRGLNKMLSFINNSPFKDVFEGD